MGSQTIASLLVVLGAGLLASACSASASPSDGVSEPAAGDPAGNSSAGPSGGPGGPGSSTDGGGSAGDGGPLSDGAAPPAPGPTMRASVRLDASTDVCDAIATGSAVYFSTATEIRAVVDASVGTTRVVGTLPSAGCGTLAATASAIYLARPKGSTGELLSAPLAGGDVVVVGTIPALTPAAANGRYPIVSDGSDVFVAASPNVWHLPALGNETLTRLVVGNYNYYATDLAMGSGTIYALNGGSSAQISQFPTTGGPYTSKSSVYGQREAFLVAGGSLFTSVSYPTTADILRVGLDFQGAPAHFAPTAANALATDGTNLYATTVAPTPQGSAIKSLAIGVYSLATGALLASYGTMITAPKAPSLKLQAELQPPLVVDATHVFVRESLGTLIAIAK